MSKKLSTKITLAQYLFPILLGMAVLLLVALGWIAYQNNVSLEKEIETGGRVAGTISALEEIERLALDLETGGRGFVITGDEEFRLPYDLAVTGLTISLPKLRNLIKDDASQLAKFSELETLIEAKIETTARNVAVRSKFGLEEAAELVSEGQGLLFMNRVQAKLAEMRIHEIETRENLERELAETVDNNFRLVPLVSSAGVLTLLMAAFFVYRESKRRYRAEDGLRQSNIELESRVSDRTGKLEELNESLKAVLSERESLLESEKSARAEAEVANRLRDEFMTALSHELRNPLNSILGWARILKKKESLEPQVMERGIDAIITSSETQSNLIEDLLDIGRIISGKFRFDMHPVNPVNLLSAAVESILPVAEHREIEIRLSIDERAVHKRVSGDLNRLLQALLNLFSNAIKFSDVGGDVTASVSVVDDFIEFKIEDKGMGISPEFLPFVFERFRQDSRQPNISAGLGLGLPIVRAIIEIHGGRVSAESEGTGKGSVFRIVLPIAEESTKSV